MTATVASAPGKIVLCGEYAVLEGAPAICMAIDRRARAEVRPARKGIMTVHATGCVEGKWRLSVGKMGVEWPDDVPELLQAAWTSTGSDGAFDIGMDTREFLDPVSGSKFGFGSSAALTAALVIALLRGTEKAADAARLATDAHRRLQLGYGSGVDIAASLHGGIIEYRMNESGCGRRLSWPAGLEFRVLWSGRPANTADKLRRFEEARRSAGPKSLTRLKDVSEQIVRCWPGGDTAELLQLLGRYVDILGEFDVDHDLGIFDAGHRAMADAASQRMLVYKPCGAGGGDTGVVLASDAGAIESFARFSESRGFTPLNVSMEKDGVIVESRSD